MAPLVTPGPEGLALVSEEWKAVWWSHVHIHFSGVFSQLTRLSCYRIAREIDTPPGFIKQTRNTEFTYTVTKSISLAI